MREKELRVRRTVRNKIKERKKVRESDYFIRLRIKILIFFLDECYSAHLNIDVHCSKSAKYFGFSSTAVSLFCNIGGVKIAL